jgi:hypothetical protein
MAELSDRISGNFFSFSAVASIRLKHRHDFSCCLIFCKRLPLLSHLLFLIICHNLHDESKEATGSRIGFA